MAVGPKPDLMNYHGVGASDRLSAYQRYKDDTLVWCAEAMQDGAARIEEAFQQFAEEMARAYVYPPRGWFRQRLWVWKMRRRRVKIVGSMPTDISDHVRKFDA